MSYIISNLQPTKGFHPTSSTTVYLSSPESIYTPCTLHLYYTLPPLVFVDTHELAQRNAHYSYSHWGSKDLEKPSHALPDEPSEVLLDVQIPPDAFDEEGAYIHVEVPMHLRYGSPRATRRTNDSQDASYEMIPVDWPLAFLLCPSTTPLKSTTSMPPLPAHIISALTSPRSRSRSLIPLPTHANFTETTTTLLLPVGDTSDLAFVEPLTAMTIFVCFLWLLRVSWRTARRINVEGDARRVKED